jgi:hypothetical protein
MARNIVSIRYLRWILVLLLAITLVALFFPWPSPRPFPVSSVQVGAGGGSREANEEKIYASSLGLLTLKNYYSFQLWFFCNDWQWEVTPEETSTYCTNRRDADHMFNLSLKPQTSGNILVAQEDVWNEP